LEPTQGDIRCIVFGHLIRLAVWHLRTGWNASLNAPERTKAVAEWISNFGGLEAVQQELQENFTTANRTQNWEVQESAGAYGKKSDEISF
jgi:hypothetical protein